MLRVRSRQGSVGKSLVEKLMRSSSGAHGVRRLRGVGRLGCGSGVRPDPRAMGLTKPFYSAIMGGGGGLLVRFLASRRFLIFLLAEALK